MSCHIVGYNVEVNQAHQDQCIVAVDSTLHYKNILGVFFSQIAFKVEGSKEIIHGDRPSVNRSPSCEQRILYVKSNFAKR